MTADGGRPRTPSDHEAQTGVRPTFEGVFPPDGAMPPESNTQREAQEDRLRAV